MGFSFTSPAPKKCDPTAENRVWGFFGEAPKTSRGNRPQSPQPRQGNRLAPTTIASGRTYWPSRDPIEERGGENLYGFVYNEPVGWIDILGRNPWSGLANAIAEKLGLKIGGGPNAAIGEQGEKISEDVEDNNEKIRKRREKMLEDLENINEDPDPDPDPIPQPSWCTYECKLLEQKNENGLVYCLYDCQHVGGGGGKKCDPEINPLRTGAKIDDKGCIFCPTDFFHIN